MQAIANSTARCADALARLLLCVLLAFASFALCPASASAAESQTKTVKVGWLLNNQGYLSGQPGEYMSGWGYEYLQTLSYYTPGWKFEYVTGSFGELMEKLESGEIDLMSNISYSEERDGKMLFSSNPQGTERYYIYAKSSRDDLTSGDPEALNSLVIGCNRGVMQTQVAQQWLKEEGISCTYRYYDSATALYEALSDDEVDAIVMNDTLSSEDAMPMFYVGESNYYLACSTKRQDLMDDINHAMVRLQSTSPRYNDEVKSRYSVSNGGLTELTKSEEKWLSSHDGGIVFGYLEDSLPYASTAADGSMEGSLTALISYLGSQYGVEVKTVGFSSRKSLNRALESGDIDVAMPVYRDFWLAEQSGLIQSSAMASCSMIALYSTSSLEAALQDIATYPSFLLSDDAIGVLYPDASILSCDSVVAAVKAVQSKRASCVIVPVAALDELRESSSLDGLATAQLSDSIELACWMRQGDCDLMTIVDKGIVASQSKIASLSQSPSTSSSARSALAVFIDEHAVAFLVCCALFLIVVIAVLAWALVSARKAQRKAQAANAAKTAFLARMSHDIRTPLNGIIGLLEISALHPQDVELAASNRSKAKVAADHLLTLINDILEMSKIEDRSIVLEHKPFNLVSLIDEVDVLVRMRASDRGVSLVTDAGAGVEHPDVLGSPLHVRRILINLLDNSIKYNKPGGSVSLATKTLGVQDGRAVCRFVVADTGIGMSEEFVEHIFEPFAQERDDARSNFQGTGMGMSIVKALVDKMEGTIQVSSRLGAGTTFTVTLPFDLGDVPSDQHAPDTACDEECSIEGASILLVEDNDLNLEIARELLASLGAQVTCARDGNEALEVFCAHSPGSFDAVLMDVMMPNMNGYDATRAIRLSGKGDAMTVPIIAMTANAFVEDVKAARQAGMNDHIAKPIDMAVLQRVIARNISGGGLI